MISLSQAARELRVGRHYLRGAVQVLGIDLVLVPPRTLLMSRRDFGRLRKRLGKPEAAATSVPG